MKIKSPLSFIQQKDLVDFDIKEINGARFIVAPGFKQLIKSSEYSAIMAHVVNDKLEDNSALPFPETQTLRKGRK